MISIRETVFGAKMTHLSWQHIASPSRRPLPDQLGAAPLNLEDARGFSHRPIRRWWQDLVDDRGSCFSTGGSYGLQTFRNRSLAEDLAFATLKQHSTPRWDRPFNNYSYSLDNSVIINIVLIIAWRINFLEPHTWCPGCHIFINRKAGR